MFLAVGDSISCIGQSVALVLADTFQHALAASRAVVVSTSAPLASPLFTLPDAIAAKSYLIEIPFGIVKGDVDTALKASATVVSGTIYVGGQKVRWELQWWWR